jgi:hypothetical protein
VAKSQTALILGAGFSCEAELPSTKTIVKTFLQSPQYGQLGVQIEDEISHQLEKFWQYAFDYDEQGPLPSLEDHFTVLDLAANSGRNIGPEYTPRKLRAIRRFSIHRIFQILEPKLPPQPDYRKAPRFTATEINRRRKHQLGRCG